MGTIARGLGAISTLLLTLLITRTLETNEAGSFLFLLASSTICSQFVNFGSHNAAIKLVGSKYKSDIDILNQDVWGVFWLIGLCGMFATTICFFATEFFFKDYKYITYIFVAGSLLSFIQLLSGCLIGLGRHVVGTMFLNSAVPLLGFLLLSAGFVFNFYEVQSPFFIYLICVAVVAILIIMFWCSQPSICWKNTLHISTPTKQHMAAMYPTVLTQMFNQYSSQFMVATLLSATHFAYISASVRVSMVVSFFIMGANLAISGRLAKLHQDNDIVAIEKLSRFISQVLVIFATPVCFLIIWQAELIMGFFGSSYTEASNVLQILVLGQWLNVMAGPVTYVLSMCGHAKILRNINFFSAAASCVLSIVLTFFFSLLGAAFAVLITGCITHYLGVYFVKKHLGFSTAVFIK